MKFIPEPVSIRGPNDPVVFRGRAWELVVVVADALFGFVTVMGFLTLLSFLGGTGSGGLGQEDLPVVVKVEACRQVGPLSSQGFGYWWQCSVSVDGGDGREVKGLVESSILEPRDIGMKLELRAACENRQKWLNCTYGQPVAKLVKGAVGILGTVVWVVALGSAVTTLVHVTRAVLGWDRYLVLYRKVNERERRRPRRKSP